MNKDKIIRPSHNLSEIILPYGRSDFALISDFKPTGDQPEAIKQLVDGLKAGTQYQTLLGVTGSGKTFTIANVIEQIQRPVLVMSHNKTLAAQLYGEFKHFFPNNAVEYFVSYYDYYQPEAYLPVTDTYIEKDLSINDEIDKLRLSTTSSLLSGRRDVIVVASVSCLYGIGNPDDFHSNIIALQNGDNMPRNLFLRKLVDSLYSRNEIKFERGHFRVRGDTVDVYLAYANYACRIVFWGDEVEKIETFDPINNIKLETLEKIVIFPANIFITTKERVEHGILSIQKELKEQIDFFNQKGKILEAKRLEQRVNYDIEMIRELGYCSGIENYSRNFDGRPVGSRPFCLLDYFPDDFLLIVDESHATIPQIHGMYGGDFQRKQNLVEYGFRLPAAFDNRPLKFDEFEKLINGAIYVSATPAQYEIEKSGGIIVEQIIRPTGLPDPMIEVRPSINQIDDLIDEIQQRVQQKERVLVTTLTKRMAEELTQYLDKMSIRTEYIHSDVETLERVRILDGLRKGNFDVLVGVNLLREGLDLPEVSLVAILDADKEGFLRSERSLTQTAGRAARNINGKVIMYADKITQSMQKTIDGTNYRREKQLKYNDEHNIIPYQVTRKQSLVPGRPYTDDIYADVDRPKIAADPVVEYMSKQGLEKAIEKTKKAMKAAAKELDYISAALYRDEMFHLQKLLKEKVSG
ncbi:MAG: excinuclease ABC subunit UvrB [Marinilabiliaceae bacterium]|nr:excinuclease ABC subunit UvrB [Marinilabiliaceae bacterium]